MASTAVPPIDYTSRDEDSTKNLMVERKPFLTPEWTDDNDFDLGMAVIDEFSAAAAIMHFYLDRAAGEGFAETCIKRESLQKLFWWWNIPASVPATVTLKFSIENSLKADILIPIETQCQTVSSESPVYFETDADLTLEYALLTADSDGSTTVYCPVTNFVAGQTVEIGDDDSSSIQRVIQSVGVNYVVLTSAVAVGFTTAQNAYISALTGTVTATEGKAGEESLANSDGTEFQKRRSQSDSIIDDSLVLVIDEGGGDVDWDAQETFYDSLSTDTHFIWKRKWDGTIETVTGDGAQGKIPTSGAIMKFTYREGGGSRGNVGTGTITQINDQILVAGTPVNVAVTNEADASGGSEEMDLPEAKIRGPEIIRTNDRYVSTPDFIAGAKSVSGVGNANAVRVTEPGVEYNVKAYIIPTGGGLPSTALKNAVEAELLSKCEIRTVPKVFDPGLARVQIGGTVHVFSNYIQSIVEEAVQDALEEFFTASNQEFGADVRESDVSRVIDEVDGVDYVNITKLTLFVDSTDIDLEIWTGDATFSDVIVGSAVGSETWTIVFDSATTFNVRGTVSGVQIATGTLGTQYVSDNGEVTFTITAGGTPMAIGDKATFRTSQYRGNIAILDDEIPVLELNDLVYSGGG